MAASALPEPRTTTAVTRALPFAERIAHPIRSPSYNYNVNHSAVLSSETKCNTPMAASPSIYIVISTSLGV